MSINRRLGRKQRGQGMTEYIIIVALIAIAAIGVFTFFGGTVRAQVAGMANELAGKEGDATQMIQRAGNAAGDAKAAAQNDKGLSDYNQKK
ncbi:MAG: pilus assembly protein [Stenotrophomonas sp.]